MDNKYNIMSINGDPHPHNYHYQIRPIINFDI